MVRAVLPRIGRFADPIADPGQRAQKRLRAGWFEKERGVEMVESEALNYASVGARRETVGTDDHLVKVGVVFQDGLAPGRDEAAQVTAGELLLHGADGRRGQKDVTEPVRVDDEDAGCGHSIGIRFLPR